MNELQTALKALNALHAKAGNIHKSEAKSILAMLHSIQFITKKLIEIFEGVGMNSQTQPINPLLVKAIFELESIETLSLQSNKPSLSNPALTLSNIFSHSQRGLNALHDLKNLLDFVTESNKGGVS